MHDDGRITEGAPDKVKSLDVTGCNLTELIGMPQEVDGKFDCRMNDITSLKGAPSRAVEFDCSDCYKLTSLAGGPDSCKVFECKDCRKLRSLTGMPKHFDSEGTFNCMQSPIASLIGCPDKIHFVVCNECKLRTLAGAPSKVHSMSVAYNELVSLQGCPQELYGNFDC